MEYGEARIRVAAKPFEICVTGDRMLGGETLEKLAAKSSAVLSPALESWSDEDRHTLATLLSRLSEDLREESAREAPAPT